ncbi:hypothetical protein FNF29_01052 [Cafeteria roenbergensis]|uniref:WW domain-containing protein n=3 Tax=Cafeteria roenbergensis TaxID=33653 RepID=A0A5A8CU72_CAFRO|nr:hypothetical protein FNF29_01052 [Cafeteria roenbergensis]|eukprot:KAA0156259.1 hypothetical protein FNF29_01052 [Cafeteria roenbergensis]
MPVWLGPSDKAPTLLKQAQQRSRGGSFASSLRGEEEDDGASYAASHASEDVSAWHAATAPRHERDAAKAALEKAKAEEAAMRLTSADALTARAMSFLGRPSADGAAPSPPWRSPEAEAKRKRQRALIRRLAVPAKPPPATSDEDTDGAPAASAASASPGRPPTSPPWRLAKRVPSMGASEHSQWRERRVQARAEAAALRGRIAKPPRSPAPGAQAAQAEHQAAASPDAPALEDEERLRTLHRAQVPVRSQSWARSRGRDKQSEAARVREREDALCPFKPQTLCSASESAQRWEMARKQSERVLKQQQLAAEEVDAGGGEGEPAGSAADGMSTIDEADEGGLLAVTESNIDAALAAQSPRKPAAGASATAAAASTAGLTRKQSLHVRQGRSLQKFALRWREAREQRRKEKELAAKASEDERAKMARAEAKKKVRNAKAVPAGMRWDERLALDAARRQLQAAAARAAEIEAFGTGETVVVPGTAWVLPGAGAAAAGGGEPTAGLGSEARSPLLGEAAAGRARRHSSGRGGGSGGHGDDEDDEWGSGSEPEGESHGERAKLVSAPSPDLSVAASEKPGSASQAGAGHAGAAPAASSEPGAPVVAPAPGVGAATRAGANAAKDIHALLSRATAKLSGTAAAPQTSALVAEAQRREAEEARRKQTRKFFKLHRLEERGRVKEAIRRAHEGVESVRERQMRELREAEAVTPPPPRQEPEALKEWRLHAADSPRHVLVKGSGSGGFPTSMARDGYKSRKLAQLEQERHERQASLSPEAAKRAARAGRAAAKATVERMRLGNEKRWSQGGFTGVLAPKSTWEEMPAGPPGKASAEGDASEDPGERVAAPALPLSRLRMRADQWTRERDEREARLQERREEEAAKALSSPVLVGMPEGTVVAARVDTTAPLSASQRRPSRASAAGTYSSSRRGGGPARRGSQEQRRADGRGPAEHSEGGHGDDSEWDSDGASLGLGKALAETSASQQAGSPAGEDAPAAASLGSQGTDAMSTGPSLALPAGWELVFDARKRPCYVNRKEGLSQTEPPTHAGERRRKRAAAAGRSRSRGPAAADSASSPPERSSGRRDHSSGSPARSRPGRPSSPVRRAFFGKSGVAPGSLEAAQALAAAHAERMRQAREAKAAAWMAAAGSTAAQPKPGASEAISAGAGGPANFSSAVERAVRGRAEAWRRRAAKATATFQRGVVVPRPDSDVVASLRADGVDVDSLVAQVEEMLAKATDDPDGQGVVDSSTAATRSARAAAKSPRRRPGAAERLREATRAMHAAASTGSPFGRTSAAPGNDSGSFSLEELMGRRASPQAVSVSPGRTPPQVSSAFGRTLPPKASDARVDASSPGKYDSPSVARGRSGSPSALRPNAASVAARDREADSPASLARALLGQFRSTSSRQSPSRTRSRGAVPARADSAAPAPAGAGSSPLGHEGGSGARPRQAGPQSKGGASAGARADRAGAPDLLSLAELGEEADAGGGTLEGAATQAQEPDSKNAAAPLAPDPEHLEGTSNDAMWLQLLDGEDSDDNGGSGAW